MHYWGYDFMKKKLLLFLFLGSLQNAHANLISLTEALKSDKRFAKLNQLQEKLPKTNQAYKTTEQQLTLKKQYDILMATAKSYCEQGYKELANFTVSKHKNSCDLFVSESKNSTLKELWSGIIVNIVAHLKKKLYLSIKKKFFTLNKQCMRLYCLWVEHTKATLHFNKNKTRFRKKFFSYPSFKKKNFKCIQAFIWKKSLIPQFLNKS